MGDQKRKAIQFFSYKDMNLALCDDGTVWKFETAFVTIDEGGKKKSVEQIVWSRQEELETPGT